MKGKAIRPLFFRITLINYSIAILARRMIQETQDISWMEDSPPEPFPASSPEGDKDYIPEVTEPERSPGKTCKNSKKQKIKYTTFFKSFVFSVFYSP